jgi:hypothetical protein
MKGTISSGAPFGILDVSQKKGAPKNKHTQIYIIWKIMINPKLLGRPTVKQGQWVRKRCMYHQLSSTSPHQFCHPYIMVKTP